MQVTDAAVKFHWLKISEDNAIELFLDHHALSSFRTCEGYFELSIVNRLKEKNLPWSLAFGIVWHEMMDRFYKMRKNSDGFDLDKWLSNAIVYWEKSKMESYAEHKSYKALKGLPGFVSMLAQYALHFSEEKERLRVIGTEIPFGKNKEVPLGEFSLNGYNVRCYLTGRLDFLMDNGFAIGPLDHKTSIFFRGNPADNYEPQDGMTGYVFAARAVVNQFFPELARNRKVDRIWMNFAQVSAVSEEKTFERFKRIPLFKTDYQLEHWRLRQLRTFSKILDFILNDRVADWNTAVCNNMFYHECPYKKLHRQGTYSSFVRVVDIDYIMADEWNPEKEVLQGE